MKRTFVVASYGSGWGHPLSGGDGVGHFLGSGRGCRLSDTWEKWMAPNLRACSPMTGEGLEPSTNGLTCLIGFHRPPCPRVRPQGRIREQGVDGLDYLFAIAGVPRLVSGAGAGDPLVPCLLITQSPCFSDPHASRCQPRCGEGALRAFQHTAASTRRGSVSSRARLLCNTPGGA